MRTEQEQAESIARNQAHFAALYESKGVVCRSCGAEGWPIQESEGSVPLLLVLLLLCLLPGLIYGTWMLTTIKPRCGSCNSASVVPRNSPEGVRMRSGR